jgi:quercetin dioxygenase-like cupin family protein
MQIRRTLIAVIVLTPFVIPGAASAQDQGPKRTVLQQTDISGVPDRQGTLYKAEFGPGVSAPKHTHPGDEFVYMAEGTLVIEPEGKDPITLKAGDSTRLPMGTVHKARNPDSSAPAVAIVFLVSEAGKPLASAAE